MIFKGPIAAAQVFRIEEEQRAYFTDSLAIEEPLEIRLDCLDPHKVRMQKSISITMRTPGHDFDLALGFLLTEGVLDSRTLVNEQVESVQHCGPAQPHLGHSNVVKVVLRNSLQVNLKSLERNFYTTSSCGVCGKASIDALFWQGGRDFASQKAVDFRVSSSLIPKLPDLLRAGQDVFTSTGGLHAAALFDAEGRMQILREDVGRHNALDKVIGWALQENRLPLNRSILVLSGRISFELVQKAAMAGITIIVAVGAPSSLALQLARDVGVTLIGFVRGERFNVYHGEERLD